MGWPITIESCSWIDFISVAYARWYHWTCGRTQRKAATINQLACPSYSLYVQLLWYPMYYPEGMKARVSPVQWSKPHSILPPLRIRTRVAGFRIISGDHYTTTAHKLTYKIIITRWLEESSSCFGLLNLIFDFLGDAFMGSLVIGVKLNFMFYKNW